MGKAKLFTYIGIADAHGIESFIPEAEAKQQLPMLVLRANCNRQRHAVVYNAQLTQKQVNLVNEFISKRDFQKALLVIKVGGRVGLYSGVQGNIQESFNQIPNPKLDPYS